jgi:hypothetical protein
VDPAGQLDIAQAAVVLQFGKQAQVNSVDFHAGILTKSEFNALRTGFLRN